MPQPEARSIFKTILWVGLLVGTLDITGATVNYMIGGGKDPIDIPVYISSGAFGPAAFEADRTNMAIAGILFHYLIAYSFTTFFFLIYQRLNLVSKNWVLTGLVYGLFIWFVMNRIVVPLTLIKRGPFNLKSAIVQASILIVMIGLPLAFIGKRYFGAK